jgi:hypothetical protein
MVTTEQFSSQQDQQSLALPITGESKFKRKDRSTLTYISQQQPLIIIEDKDRQTDNSLYKEKIYDSIQMKLEKNVNIKKFLTAYPPTTGDTEYQKTYSLLIDRIVTDNFARKKDAVIFNGKDEVVESILSRPTFKEELRVSTQCSRDVNGWNKDNNSKRIDCIVIEFDGIELVSQMQVINESGVPYSFAVYSGNKSIHFFIILQDAISESKMKTYRKGLGTIFPDADKSVLSRLNAFVRFPINKKNCFQPLLGISKGLVKNTSFDEWYQNEIEKTKEKSTESDLYGNPNSLFDFLNKNIEGRYCYNPDRSCWYKIKGNSKILIPISRNEFNKIFNNLYRNEVLKRKRKLKGSDRRDLLGFIEEVNQVSISPSNGKEVALEDGSLLNIKTGLISELEYSTDFYLPFTKEQWKEDIPTKRWDEFCTSHATKEDIELLMILLGFIFSGANIKLNPIAIIIEGPSDTGKSRLTEFISLILPSYTCNLSAMDALTNPALAVSIIGKRVCTSDEANIKINVGAKFRSLITGEKVTVHEYYRGKYNVEHNAIFVSTTNPNDGFIENSPENKKRIRVIRWDHPTKTKDMDHQLVDKLIMEAPGIIIKALKAYKEYIEKRIPINRSTETFMKESGQNINSIADWLDSKDIHVGTNFITTEKLLQKYKLDTGDGRMTISVFGRKARKALGESPVKKSLDGKQVRGYNLNISCIHGGIYER